MVDHDQLTRHLQDYEQVFGQRTKAFVCPLTLKPCEPESLINGHILNARLTNTSRRQVIQYGPIDNFYGTRVEPSLVRFFNLHKLSPADLLSANSTMEMQFGDGSSVPCFVTFGKRARAAAQQFPIVDAHAGGETVPVFVRVAHDDPRLHGPMRLVGSESFMPSHWVAALLKAGFLAMFEMIGYKAVRDPMGDTIRQTLARYYRENGSRDDATEYFKDFQNAIRVLGHGTQPSDIVKNYKAVPFDTLENRIVLLHFSGASKDLMFAATCVFRINGVTVTITMPQMLGHGDIALAWRLYQRMLYQHSDVQQRIYRGRFEGSHWAVETTPMNTTYVDHVASDEDPPTHVG